MRNLAVEGLNDPAVQSAWQEGERRLRAICDPEAVNAQCFADQKRRIAELGGREACANAFVFNHTPTPTEPGLMSIRQMKALDAIGRHGSFAAAARALNLTQSAISMQISALEESLAVTLFDRSHRPPRVTKDGAMVMRRAQAIVAEYDRMLGALEDTRSQRGVFRLGAIPTVLTNVLPEALMALRSQQADLIVNVTSNLSGDLMQQVGLGELDAALMHQPREIDEAFDWHEVAPQRIVIVAPPKSREKTPEAVFAAHPYIRFNRSAWVAPMIEGRLAEMEIEPETRAEIQSIEAIHLMVNLGFGASILPDVGVDTLGAKLRIVPFGVPPLYRSIGLLSRRDMAGRKAMRVVREVFLRIGDTRT